MIVGRVGLIPRVRLAGTLSPETKEHPMHITGNVARFQLSAGTWLGGAASDLLQDAIRTDHETDGTMTITSKGEVVGIMARSTDFAPYSCIVRAEHAANGAEAQNVTILSDGDLVAHVEFVPGNPLFKRPDANAIVVQRDGCNVVRLA